MDTEINSKGDKVIATNTINQRQGTRINLNENIYGTFAEIELAKKR
jgi:hypothetical protein